MSRFPSKAHFASFLGLCPDNQITGGKVLRRGTRHVENRAATAFRMAATSLWRSKTYLGAKFRRLRARLGAPKAITAMAHMLARLVYRMLKYGEQYVDKGMKYYEEKYRAHEIRRSEKSERARTRSHPEFHCRSIREVSEEAFPGIAEEGLLPYVDP